MSDEILRRARPWLGTMVDVTVRAGNVDTARHALEAAFSAMARVHRLMSPIEPASDVAAINRAAAGESVAVSRETFTVLAFCERLNRASQGLFDPCCAANSAGRWADLTLDHDSLRVWVRQRVRMDLGGVAKGYAVDEAVRAACAAGASSGLINAGGDMRAWGDTPVAVHIRHPVQRAGIPAGNLSNAALATSALGESRYVNTICFGAPLPFVSASVTAPDCMAADALTKVVLASPAPPLTLLAEYNAAALVIDPDGAIYLTRQPLLPEINIVNVRASERDALEIAHV